MADTIQIRRGTTSAWNSANPVLALGEQGYDTTTRQYKVGDGTTAWTALAYSTPGHIAANTVLANPTGSTANPVGVDAAGMRTLIGAATAISYSAIPAFAIDVSNRVNTKSISTNATFTFTGTPTTGQIVGLKLTTDASDRLVTLPEFWCRNRQQLITQVNCHESSTYLFEFEWTGSRWESDSYRLGLFDRDNHTLFIGDDIGINESGTGSVFIGSDIGVGTRQGVPVGAGTRMNTVTDSVFIGFGAAECLISGNGQVAIGRLSLGQCLTGQNNTAVGDTSLSRTLGDFNIGIGYQGGTGNVNGDSNIFVGHYAGGLDRDKGDFNICVGSYAGNGLLGGNNIFFGNTSGPGNSFGSSTCNHNLGIGFESLNGLTTGDNNIAIGDQCAKMITTGNGNIFIGDRSGSDGQKVDAVNTICLGDGTQSTANNQMVLGNTSIVDTVIRGSTLIDLQGPARSTSLSTELITIRSGATVTGYIFGDSTALLKTYTQSSPSATAASPRQLARVESGGLFTNTGSTQECRLLLDDGVAGDCYEFVCTDADGIRITARGIDTIRDGATVSSAAGYIRSSVIGSAISLKCVAANLWFVVSKTGTWTMDS